MHTDVAELDWSVNSLELQSLIRPYAHGIAFADVLVPSYYRAVDDTWCCHIIGLFFHIGKRAEYIQYMASNGTCYSYGIEQKKPLYKNSVGTL